MSALDAWVAAWSDAERARREYVAAWSAGPLASPAAATVALRRAWASAQHRQMELFDELPLVDRVRALELAR